MIPRKDIIAVSKQSSIKDVREKFKQVLHSRVIVYDKTIDTIIGYIDLGDIFASSQRITDMVKPVFFVPESRKLFDIFQDFFRHKDTHIAVVVDEYGGTTGIISVTDLTEEIIGDFKIDSGVRGRKKTQPEWLQQDATTFVVNGKLKTEVFRDVSFIDITGESYETVAGFVLDHLQRPVEDDLIFKHIYYGLNALQHRGQEGAGIVTCEKKNYKKRFSIHKGFGLVSDVFKPTDSLKDMMSRAYSGIGHTRYSTSGSSTLTENIQPLYAKYHGGNLAIAHNGNLTNAKPLRESLIKDGIIFKASSDTEILLHLIARSKKDTLLERIEEALLQVEGSYSLVILTEEGLIAARDPKGFRPLVIGKKILDDGTVLNVIASETCAFDISKIVYEREIEPGEILLTNQQQISLHLPRTPKRARCIFEYVYFSRPDSTIFGHSVDKVRRKLGKNLAQESPIEDLKKEDYATVISVPDSSNTSALGYVTESNKLGYPSRIEIGLIRNHYTGRTFINPSEKDRSQQVRSKLNAVKGILHNRCLVIVDDSIVRGTTIKELVKLIKEGQPQSIHFRIASPPIISPCYYGIDISDKEKLIAHHFRENISKLAEHFEIDSLKYLSFEKLIESVPKYEDEETSYCTGCFTGNYPTSTENVTLNKDEND
ncbi:hypothetical protein CHS0354_000526 [Potamilus streckersoni]|uniref:Amidophosphoribosyltransferase n=1 Tax=Potamilus streckersoni TaxID=2493646 RepID=A0AAE0T7R6_9BIVA|nr:hypothetical protein CHS0354_000526 [Potamilus streckersoni]